jgi:guanylate kinase
MPTCPEGRTCSGFAALERFQRPSPLLVVISGPSGVGKDSVIARMRENGIPFHFVVTATSRCPRSEERHGVDYYFVSAADFERMIAEDALLEYALVYDQYKGVPKEQVRQALATGLDVVMRVDVQGVSTLRRRAPGAITIFIAPPSIEALRGRLERRAADDPAQLQQRLQTALQEMGAMAEFDYVVVNQEGKLDQTVEQVCAILTAEKCRTARRPVAL